MEAVTLFGHTPRICFYAAMGPTTKQIVEQHTTLAIREMANNMLELFKHNDPLHDTYSHRLFEVDPSCNNRFFGDANVRPVSDTILDELLKEHRRRQHCSSFRQFIQLVTGFTPTLAYSAFRRRVHTYLGSQSAGKPWRLIPLNQDAPSGRLKGGFQTHLCTSDLEFGTQLAAHVRPFDSIYLYSHSQMFPTVDAIAYRHGQPLTVFHVAKDGGDVIIDETALRRFRTILHRLVIEALPTGGPERDRLAHLSMTVPWRLVIVVQRRSGGRCGRRKPVIVRPYLFDNGATVQLPSHRSAFVLELDSSKLFADPKDQ
jgi:hypothetical protein